MSSLFSLLGTMSSSMLAQQAALNVTGQNVANASTPGYVDRTAQLETQATLPGTDGGVVVAGVQRAYNAFTFGQVLDQSGLKSAADAGSQALTAAQNVLAPPGGGDVGSEMTAFFGSVTELENSPSDTSARSGVLAQATRLAQSISTTATGLQEQQATMLSAAQGSASQVNDDLSRIAALNQQITQAQAEGDQAPDLRDKRDSLITDVAGQIGARVVADPSGSVTLFAANGVLVDGDQASALSVGVDSSGALQVTAKRSGVSTDITSGITQGTLGGLREARDTDVAGSLTQLDQFAYTFANAVNSVHQTGYGLDGVSGRPLFAPHAGVAGAAAAFAVDPSVAGHPERIAAAQSAQDVPGGNDAAVALAQLASQPLGASTSPAAAYAAISSGLGSSLAAAQADATTRAETLTQAQNLNSSASGVSLPEESMRLTQFQQAFQASQQVIQVTDNLLNGLMSMMTNVGA